MVLGGGLIGAIHCRAQINWSEADAGVDTR
jgi:hypothetical protein